MNDGQHTVYCIEHRTVAKNEWLKEKSPLKPVKLDEWAGSSWDTFRKAINPSKWSKDGQHLNYQFPKVEEETSHVYRTTSMHGFFTEKYALDALVRLRKADDEGMFDSYDGYGRYCQSVRHEFRIIKLEISKKTTLIAEMRTKWTEGK